MRERWTMAAGMRTNGEGTNSANRGWRSPLFTFLKDSASHPRLCPDGHLERIDQPVPPPPHRQEPRPCSLEEPGLRFGICGGGWPRQWQFMVLFIELVGCLPVPAGICPHSVRARELGCMKGSVWSEAVIILACSRHCRIVAVPGTRRVRERDL